MLNFFPSLFVWFFPLMVKLSILIIVAFLLTFPPRAFAEPVERYERARSLPTHSSKQESDAASIRPDSQHVRSIQPES